MKAVLTNCLNATKLSTNLTYCMLNDEIQHLIKQQLIVCWEEVTGETDLHDFAGREPSWDEIEELSQRIFDEQFLGVDFKYLQELPNAEHDMKWENQLLFNQDVVLYALLALALNMLWA